MKHIFVWTLKDIVAVAFVLFLLIFGLLVGAVHLREKFQARRRKG